MIGRESASGKPLENVRGSQKAGDAERGNGDGSWCSIAVTFRGVSSKKQ